MTFVDTNVLLYAVSGDPAEAPKAAVALAVLKRRDLALSVQVLQEFFVQATHARRRHPLRTVDAEGLVRAFLRYPVLPMTVGLVVAAMKARDTFQVSYWDAAVIEAARQSGCQELLSEDLQDGCDYGGVVVRNPFAPIS